MVNGTEDQIERLIQAVNEIADLIPTSAESSADLTGQPGAVGGLPLDQLVDANIGHILGANPSKDPQRIVALLTGAFEKQPGGTMNDYQWRQRGSVPVEGSDGGPVAGEQATVYQELKEREEAANRLLDAVVPVILGPDEDEIIELKDRIRTTLSGIVAEAGRPGGAVLDRIDVQLQTLDSDFQELKEKLGLDDKNQPPDELRKELDFATAEQIRANFDSLDKAYIGTGTLTEVRNRLERANNSPGTRLSRLVRSIEAIPNTVQQAYTVMNSVRFGAAERRVTGVSSNNDTTTFEQLFNWIEQSASTDWPSTLIGGGAKRSEVLAVKLTAEKQSDKLAQLTRNNNARLKELMDVGVNRASTVISELRRELKVVKDLTGDIAGKPVIQTITPTTGSADGNETVRITGFNLQKVRVFFGTAEGKIKPLLDANGNEVENKDGTSIDVKTPPKDPNDPAVVDVTLREGDVIIDTLTEGFAYIQPAAQPATPTFTKLSPDRGSEGQKVLLIGSNLSTISKVSFEGTDATDLDVDDDGTFIEFEAPYGQPGTKAGIVVIDEDGQQYDTHFVFSFEGSGT